MRRLIQRKSFTKSDSNKSQRYSITRMINDHRKLRYYRNITRSFGVLLQIWILQYAFKPDPRGLFIPLCVSSYLIITIFIEIKGGLLRKRITNQIEQIQSEETIGFLIEIAALPASPASKLLAPGWHKEAISKLYGLLPILNQEIIENINRTHQKQILIILKRDYNNEKLIIALLKLIVRANSTWAISVIQRLAIKTKSSSIRDHTQKTLSMLQNIKETDLLLRASMKHKEAINHLPHLISQNIEMESKEMIRPITDLPQSAD